MEIQNSRRKVLHLARAKGSRWLAVVLMLSWVAALLGACPPRADAETVARLDFPQTTIPGDKILMIVDARIGRKAGGKWQQDMRSTGYLLTLPLAASEKDPADYKLFGPLWNFPEPGNQGGSIPTIQFRHPLDAIPLWPPPQWAFDLRTGALTRWSEVGQPRNPATNQTRSATYRLSSFDTAGAKWLPPRKVELNWAYTERQFAWRPRFVWGFQFENGKAKSLVYDLFTDTDCRDEWLNGILRDLRNDKDLGPNNILIDDDLKWAIVEVTHHVIDIEEPGDVQRARAEAARPIVYRDLSFDPRKSFLLFQRGEKPVVVDRIEKSHGILDPIDAFQDRRGKLLFFYDFCTMKSSTFTLAPFKGGSPYVLEDRDACGPARDYFDPEKSMLTAIDTKGNFAAMERAGATLGCEIRIMTWKYLEDKYVHRTIELDDLFKIEGDTLTPNPKRTVAVREP